VKRFYYKQLEINPSEVAENASEIAKDGSEKNRGNN